MRIEGVNKAFGEAVVLRDVTFTVGPGITCLMAPSGRGKTTLLRILLGLETADGGFVRDLPARWGAMFQEDRLLPRLTAMENLRFALGPALDEAAAADMLRRLGLGDEGDKRVRDYSGGMKRRLALARALLRPCDGYLLDEPFTGLDEGNKAVCLALIREAAEKAPVLLVTHEAADADALGGTVVRL